MKIVVCAACGYRVEGDAPDKCGRCGHADWTPLLDLTYNDRNFLRALRISSEP